MLTARELSERGAGELALRDEAASPASLQSPSVRGDVAARRQNDRRAGAVLEKRLTDREAVEAATADLETADDLHASAAYRRRVAATLACRAIADARDEAGGRHAG